MKIFVIAFDDDPPDFAFTTRALAEAFVLEQQTAAFERHVAARTASLEYAEQWVKAGGGLSEPPRPVLTFDEWLPLHGWYYGRVAEVELVE